MASIRLKKKNPGVAAVAVGCRIQDPGTRGDRWWKTADFSHSVGTARAQRTVRPPPMGRSGSTRAIFRVVHGPLQIPPPPYKAPTPPTWTEQTPCLFIWRIEGGGFGMTPWCDDLVCSWRRLLADRHSLPFPWTLSLHRRRCPSASHHPLTFLFLPALTFPLPSPFPSLGLFLRRPRCPSASPHSFPSLSLGRLCQRSPRTCPVSLLCVESTQRGGGWS